VNLIEWLKMMVTNKRAEEVVDPNLEDKPPKRALKRAILVGFKCVDPDADKRPKMSHVVQMLEAIQNAYHQVLILSYTSFFLSTIFFLISTVLEHLLTSVYFFFVFLSSMKDQRKLSQVGSMDIESQQSLEETSNSADA